MKNNNVFKYIFIVFIIILIIGTVYVLYRQNVQNDEIEEENTTQEATIEMMDNLTMGISNYDTMNPLLTNNKEIINISKLIFEPLLNITSDYRVENCLATSWTKTDDTTYEVKLDTSIKWQDGSSLIARDVSFTIEKLKERNTAYSANVADIANVETPDTETVIIHLSRAVPFFEFNLSFPILPSMYYLNEDFETTNKIPIGTGMYKIASIDDNTILLTRNDRWRYVKDKTPKAQSITIKRYATMGEIYNSFKLGNIDIINTSTSTYSDHIGTMGYNKKEYKGRNYDYLSLNCSDIILQDKAVRQAINYAIDKNTLVSTVFSNNYYVANSPLDYGSYLYSQEGEISYNQSKARETLEQAGWIYQNDRWQKSINGYVRRLTLSLVVSEDNAERVSVANEIKRQLEAVGINVNITKVSNDRYYEYLSDKNYQMILTGVTNSMNPDLSYFYGDGNIANYNNQDVKSKLNSLDNFDEIQKAVNDDVPYIGLYRSRNTLILNANVGGNFAPNSYNVYNNFNEWFRQK